MITIIYIAYFVTTLLAIINLILFGSRPAKSVSWLLVIIMVPFIGSLFYVLIGINRRKYKFLTLRQTKKMKRYDEKHQEAISNIDLKNHASITSYEKLVNLISKNSKFSPFDGNKVAVFYSGKNAFNEIFKAINNAEKFIHVQFYIFEKGEILEKLFELFKVKISEGVEVRVIYDAIGSYSLQRRIVKKFKKIGVKVYPTMPLKLGRILFTINYRNHRKIIVIDGKVAFTGGMNISDKYIKASSELGVWYDVHLSIIGPAVQSLGHIFSKDYYFASGIETLQQSEYFPKVKKQGNSVVQIVSSGPDSDFSAIMQQYLMLITQAKKYICIANSYFIPGVVILEAIKLAALSGIEVKLLVPNKSDSIFVKYSMFSYFDELLAAGIKIYLYKSTFLHSKVIIVDDEIASVGTGNFDNRSFEQNFEVNTLIYDNQLAKEMKNHFLNDCDISTFLSKEDFSKRSLGNKFIEGIARIFSPLL